MKHLPLNIVFLSTFFAIFYANTCGNGWILVKKYCYQIHTNSTKIEQSDVCNQYADVVPKDLLNKLGYSELTWIKKDGKMRLVSVETRKNLNHKNGHYYSVCKKEPGNKKSFIIRKNVTFFDGRWIIPNALSIIIQIKNYMTEQRDNSTVWFGMLYKPNATWTNSLRVSGNQAKLLNINIDGITGQCGVYSLVNNFTITNCSEYHNGLALTNETLEVTTTEEITSTQPPTIRTSAPEETTSPQMPTIQTSETEEITSPQMSTIQTSDKTVTHSTSPENTTPKLCFCQCRKNPNESMEDIKELKVKNTDLSKYKRSKTSAPDERTSSRVIGFVAIVILVVPFGLIILSDIPIMLQPLHQIYLQRKKISKNGHRATLKV